MPHPFIPKKNMAAHSKPNVILERPELAQLLGAICAEWGRIDDIYLDIFNLITFSHKIPVIAHSISEVSVELFKCFRSFQAKEEAIKRVLSVKIGNGVDEEFEKISYLSEKKQSIVICSFMQIGKYPIHFRKT